MSSFSLLISRLEQLVDLAQRRADLRLVVLGHARAARSARIAGVDQQPVHRLLALGDLLEDQVAVLHERHEVLAAVAEQLRSRSWSSRSRAWISASREATVSESRAMPSKLASISGAAWFIVVDTTSSAWTSSSRVDLLGGGGQVAEDADDVVRRLGALERDRRVLGQLALAGGRQLEVLLPEQVEHLDGGARCPRRTRPRGRPRTSRSPWSPRATDVLDPATRMPPTCTMLPRWMPLASVNSAV